MPIQCDVVTQDRMVFSEQVDMVIAPGVEGLLGILPHHAPLMTSLSFGELVIRREGEEDMFLAIGGGFLEVSNNRVTVLADSAEIADEIDIERAEAARRRAEERLEEARKAKVDAAQAEAALRRSMTRLRVAERRRRHGGRSAGPPGGSS